MSHAAVYILFFLLSIVYFMMIKMDVENRNNGFNYVFRVSQQSGIERKNQIELTVATRNHLLTYF